MEKVETVDVEISVPVRLYRDASLEGFVHGVLISQVLGTWLAIGRQAVLQIGEERADEILIKLSK